MRKQSCQHHSFLAQLGSSETHLAGILADCRLHFWRFLDLSAGFFGRTYETSVAIACIQCIKQSINKDQYLSTTTPQSRNSAEGETADWQGKNPFHTSLSLTRRPRPTLQVSFTFNRQVKVHLEVVGPLRTCGACVGSCQAQTYCMSVYADVMATALSSDREVDLTSPTGCFDVKNTMLNLVKFVTWHVWKRFQFLLWSWTLSREE